MKRRSPCGVHLHPRPVLRCDLCAAALAELREMTVERSPYARSGRSEQATAARARGREKQRREGRGIDAANRLSVARQRAWHRDDARAKP